MKKRSDCPISSLLDHAGDKWSLLIIRDLALFGKKTYKELQNSAEKIATNILATRLENLEQSGLINKQTDPNDKRKKQYQLTEKGKDLIPILLEMILFSTKYEENCDTPDDFLQRIKEDRQALIADLKRL